MKTKTELMAINDIPVFGKELSEDDLRLATGGADKVCTTTIDEVSYDSSGKVIDSSYTVKHYQC
jgi:hypothetical protein